MFPKPSLQYRLATDLFLSAALLLSFVPLIQGADGPASDAWPALEGKKGAPTKKWSAIAPFPDGRSHFESSTIIHERQILVIGGRCNSSKPPRGVVGDILEYDPEKDVWRVVGNMPVKLLAPAAAIISGQIVLTGGGLNNPLPLADATWTTPLPPGS